ncbi:MAG: phytanoyl-CoA dioxygenase family protein [Microcoleus sp.]
MERLNEKLQDILGGSKGFMTGIKLESEEVEWIKSVIETQWLDVIRDVAPECTQIFAEQGIEKHHKIAHMIDHSYAFRKKNRVFPSELFNNLRDLSIFKQIESELGAFDIWQEEIYWRIVRPDQKQDVAPLHADKWFWELGVNGIDLPNPNGLKPPDNKTPIKCWIAICCEPGLSGLRIVPGSHLRDWPYHAVKRNDSLMPKIDAKEEDISSQIFHSQPGDAIIFGEKLIHGGVIGGSNTRISIEVTLLFCCS